MNLNNSFCAQENAKHCSNNRDRITEKVIQFLSNIKDWNIIKYLFASANKIKFHFEINIFAMDKFTDNKRK